MIIHTVLSCLECKFLHHDVWFGSTCNYHDGREIDLDTNTIPDWCVLRTNAILVMTDPVKLLRKEEEAVNGGDSNSGDEVSSSASPVGDVGDSESGTDTQDT